MQTIGWNAWKLCCSNKEKKGRNVSEISIISYFFHKMARKSDILKSNHDLRWIFACALEKKNEGLSKRLSATFSLFTKKWNSATNTVKIQLNFGALRLLKLLTNFLWALTLVNSLKPNARQSSAAGLSSSNYLCFMRAVAASYPFKFHCPFSSSSPDSLPSLATFYSGLLVYAI